MTIATKQIIIEAARQLGFSHAVIASLAPMEAARKIYEEWLARGYAATMEYLKRDPVARNTPQLLHPQAYSAIVLLAPYYTELPADPGPQYGRVARYAVGKDYHEVLPARLAQLKGLLEGKLNRPLLGKAFTDDVQLFEQAFAARNGLGFIGKNSLLIGPKMLGSYHFICELLTDLPLEADEPYNGTCGNCFRCGIACPTGAIVEPGTVDSNQCISFLTIENKGAIPLSLRPKLGSWLLGCDICQEVCPYNHKVRNTAWPEFQPESGAGHYLDLFSILAIDNQRAFMEKFAGTAVSRPKRRGLVRNALVVIGNNKPEGGEERLAAFLRREENPLLREHAYWALSSYGTQEAQRLLEEFTLIDPDTTVQATLEKNIS